MSRPLRRFRIDTGAGSSYGVQPMSISGWIGVDLDATLARYDGWKGVEHIGEPIPLMLERVKGWIAEGVSVKIFTARASVPEAIPPIEAWLEKHGIGGLSVTNVKDFAIVELWDDRAVQVEPNTGVRLGKPNRKR